MTGGAIDGSGPSQRISVDQNVKSVLVGQDGYHYAGGGQGGFYVISDNPWVSITDTAPSAAAEDDIVTVSFSVDTDSDYEVRLGGDRNGSGTLLSEGSATADTVIDVSFTVDAAWSEGANAVYVIATDDQMRTGHAKTTLCLLYTSPSPRD